MRMSIILAISLDAFKNPGAYFSRLFKLYEDRKIIFATNKKMREEYSRINDGENVHVDAVYNLMKKAGKQSLHYELDEAFPCFTDDSTPHDISRISTALISKNDIKKHVWGAAYIDSTDYGYAVCTSLEDIPSGPKRIYAKSECRLLEQHLLSKVRWARRITIIDPYALSSECNLRGTIRFLDFLYEESTQLKQIRFVMGQHYKETIIQTNANGKQDTVSVDHRGKDARTKYLKLFKQKILEHNIFNRTELIQVSWSSGNSKRYLSFGRDSKEITLPFDKGISVHFQVNRNDKLAHDIDLSEQYGQEISEETVEFEYEVISPQSE